MTAWRRVQFGDLVDFHNRRRVPLSKAVRATRPGPYPYFGAQGIVDRIDDFIFDGEFLLVAEDGENLRSRKAPIARLATGRFWVNNHAHIVKPKPGLADENFLLHLLNNMPLAGRVTGAAQPKLTKANLADLEFECPPYELQLRIGAFLSAFDELIEINKRRIELLEDLVRSLYREWFVHFRFPGHEDVEFVDSELGPIPKGWVTSSAGEIFHVNPSVSSLQDDYRKVTMGDVSARASHVLPSKLTKRASGSRFRRGDVLLARITPCLENGKTALALFPETDEMAVGSTEFIVLRGIDVGPGFVYCAARSSELRDHAIKSMSGASGRQRVPTDAFKSLRMVKPPLEVAELFEDVSMPKLESVFQYRLQSEQFAATRDLLLPRLVTGQLDISDLDLGVLTPAEAE